MSISITGLVRRMALVRGAADELTDIAGQKPAIPRGNGVVFQHALFTGDPRETNFVDTWTGVASVTAQFRKTSALGDALFDVTVPVAEINTALTYEEWSAGTGQHLSIELDDTLTNQDLAGKAELPIYIAWQVNLTGKPPVYFGKTSTTIFEEGIGSSGVPVVGDPLYLTAAQARAEFAPVAAISRVAVPAGFISAGVPGQYAIDAANGRRWDYLGDGATHSWGYSTLITSA